jgi:transposase
LGRYRNKGIEGLKEGRRSGRPRLIDKEQQEQFKSLFLNAQATRFFKLNSLTSI